MLHYAAMQGLETSELKIVPAIDSAGSVLALTWLGRSSDRVPSTILEPFFANVLSAAQTHQWSVVMHFEQMEYFNSSTITAIIALIQDARNQGVRLTLTYQGSLKWQRLSFDALQMFAQDDGMFQVKAMS